MGQSQIRSTLGPPWIRLVPVHPTDARLDWDLGNMEASSTTWALSFLGPFLSSLQCGRAYCPAIGECCCHRRVYLVCNSFWVGGACEVASTWRPGPEGFPAEHLIVVRWSVISTSPVTCGFNVFADQCTSPKSFTSVSLTNSVPSERCLSAAWTETDGKVLNSVHP